MRKYLLLLLAPLLLGVSDYDMSHYDVEVNSLTCVTGTCGVPAPGGDNIEVNGVSSTDPDLLDTTTIGVTLDTGPTPDEVTFDVNADSIGLTELEEDEIGVAVINDSPNFVGIVRCATAISGTTANCTARVTTFNSVTLDDGWVEMSGNFNPTTPHTTSNGFRVDGAVFLSDACNSDANGCGPAWTDLSNNVHTIARTIDDSSISASGVRIKWQSARYRFRNCSTFDTEQNGITIDATNSPSIEIDEDLECTTTLPDVDISTGTDPSEITFDTTVCGTGTCIDGDEIARPGMTVLLSDSGSWEDGGRRVILYHIASDGLSAIIWPPQTSDYNGAAVAASGIVLQMEPNPNFGGIGMEGLLTIICTSACAAANDYDGTDTTTNRVTPMTVVAMRPGLHNEAKIDSIGFCHKDDVGFLATYDNIGTGSVGSGAFEGHRVLSCATTNGSYYQLFGNDDTTTSDDGLGMAFRIQSPNFEWRTQATWGIRNNIAIGVAGGGNLDIDAGNMEDTHQLLYAPRGVQNMVIRNISREQGLQCLSGSTCPAVSQRRAFIEVGDWNSTPGTSGFGAALSFLFEKVWLGGGGAARPFLKVDGATRTYIRLEGVVEDTTDLLDIDNNGTTVVGHLVCEDATAGACDLPASGTYPDLMIMDEAGTVLTDTR